MIRQAIIEVPEEALRLFGEDTKRFGREMYETAVVKWYDEGLITSGKGAELLGLPREDSLELLSWHKVSPFQYAPEELREEFKRV